MRKLSPAMLEHLRSPVTTLATCWKLFLRSGQIQGFTDFDCNLTIDSLTYHPDFRSFSSKKTNNNDKSIA
jgi:hypothetical protein